MSKYDYPLMKTAEAWAEVSSCKRRKVGAVISSNNRIISTGYNGTVSGMSNECENLSKETKDTVIHAEMNAILHAARNGIALEGTTLHSTFAPCDKCAVAISQVGIVKVVYTNEDSNRLSGIYLLNELGVQTKTI